MKTKTAYSYKRFSSVGQGQGSSIERQLEEAQSVCLEKGWKLVDLPADRGLSGFTGANKHRGALGLFLRKVTSGDVEKGSVLIIEKLDRFSRNEVDLVLPDFLALLQSGVEIFSCIDKTHYTLTLIRANPMMLNYAVMGMAMANDFSKTLSLRISNTFNLKYSAASKGQKVLFGSWQPRWVDFTGDKNNGKFTLNKKAETVLEIVRMYLKGDSMWRIASDFNKRGIKSLGSGRQWTQGQIGQLLSSGHLLGHCEIKGKKFDRYFPPVVSDNEWKQLQAKLKDNSNRKGGSKEGQYIVNLFRNRCRCASCGKTITSHCGKTHYYMCRESRIGDCKVRTLLEIRDIEWHFFGLFLQEMPSTLLGKNTPKQQNQISHLKQIVACIDKQINDTVRLIGTVDLPELQTKLIKLKSNRKQATEKLQEEINVMRQSNNIPPVLEDLKAIIKSDNDADIAEAFTTMAQQLRQPEVREKILGLIPSLISHLTIDLEERQYVVHFLNGEMSETQTLLDPKDVDQEEVFKTLVPSLKQKHSVKK
jgi:DNA invertase Pin-like site-specific DNA recombinase